MLEVFFQSSPLVSLLGALVGLLVLHLLYTSLNSQDQCKDPPGPKPLPLIGNLFQVDLGNLYYSLFQMSKEYGSVFTVRFGPQKVVVLAGYKTVKQALVNHAEEFGDRDINPIFHDLNQGHGIMFANGETWREMRRFALTTLRDFGMGKRISEERIIEEAHHLIKEFEEHEGKPFDNNETITFATTNIISALLCGRRFDYKDPHLRYELTRDQESNRLSATASMQLYNFYPWMGPFIKNWRTIQKNMNEGFTYLRKIIKDRRAMLIPEMCECLIDVFLQHKKHLEETGINDSLYNEDNLVHSVSNLFLAGTDTTGNTLQWCVLIMAKFPNYQDKVQEEIDRVIGTRQVRIEDRKNMPFIDAVIHESQRIANIVPMSIPHKTSRDVSFKGYTIKKGTTVFPLLTSVLYDETEWETPNTYNPYHFLDKDGKFVRRDAFMAFSAGRRVCLGESLARMELFIFFTSLLQRFRFTPPPGMKPEDLVLTPVVGFNLTTTPHKLCALNR